MTKHRGGIAAATVAIVERGGYASGSGRRVDIADAVRLAVAGTRLYLPEAPLPAGTAAPGPGRVEVTSESSLAATRRLHADGRQEAVACLNFASAKNPGGGFLRGADAQEESLARASALYACLRAAPDFYAFHRAQGDLRYSDRVIYSPGVPVFRDDHGRLLEEPYPVAFLTAAAPNAGAIMRQQRAAAATIPDVLASRARRVLDVAAANGHRRLVLGAWGCGVFANVPAVVAGTFADVLGAEDRFELVTFAVLDHRPGTPVFTAFARALGPPG